MSDDAPTFAPTFFDVRVFQASTIVERLHNYPRYGGENDFTLDNAYRDSLQAVFYTICIGGAVLLILQWLFFCCQKWLGGLCCCINFCSVSVYKVILSLAFIWLLVGTGLSFWGRDDFRNGAERTYQLALHLGNIFDGIETDSDTLTDASKALIIIADKGVCNNTTSVNQSISVNQGYANAADSLSDASDHIANLVDGIAKKLDRIATLFDKDVPTYIDFGIGFVTGLMSLTVFSGLWVVSCGSPESQNTMIVIATFVLSLFCPLIAFEITFSLVLSDFCYGLDDTLMVAANEYAPSNALDLIEHYVYCNSTNPLQPFINESIMSLEQLNDTIYSGRRGCNATLLHHSRLEVEDSITAVQSIEESISCVGINPLITHLMHSIVCNDVIGGVYNLWVVQLSCALLLWFLLYFVRWEVLQIRRVDRMELLKAEKRLGVKDEMFIPTGRMAKRKYDQQKKKEQDEEERLIAAKRAKETAARELERQAWREARERLIRQAEVHSMKKWLVSREEEEPNSPTRVVFTDQAQRREHALVVGQMATAVRQGDTEERASIQMRRMTTRDSS